MASSTTMALLAMFLLVLPMTAFGDDIDLAPFYQKLCDEVECGKGTCVTNSSATFGFQCECDANWKRTTLENEDGLEFLPCVIPECSVQYSCVPAPPPSPPVPHNSSIFDPCYWMYCGGGTCKRSNTYKVTCECDTGYSNLMNSTYYPCFNDCAIGSDCEKLGVKVSNSTSTSDNESNGHIFLPGKSLWMTIFTAAVALIL